MRRLILLRHGKAEVAGPTGGDRDRPLARRGRVDVAMTARWLLNVGCAPDLVYVSPAQRTVSSWESARETFPKARVEVRDDLYMADVEAIVDVLAGAPANADTVMVIGHNPGLQELGLKLAIEGAASPLQINRIAEGFPTAAACVLRMNHLHGAALEAVFEPPRRTGAEPRWAFFSATPGRSGVSRIYKILERHAWEAALLAGRYEGSDVDRADGFIHFSTAFQAVETARRHFAGRENLMLLTVDVEGLGDALRWEVSRGGALFPHLYGPLYPEQVLEARSLRLDRSGIPVLGALTP